MMTFINEKALEIPGAAYNGPQHKQTLDSLDSSHAQIIPYLGRKLKMRQELTAGIANADIYVGARNDSFPSIGGEVPVRPKGIGIIC